MRFVERAQGSIDAFRNHEAYKDNHRQTNNKETTTKHQSTDFLSSESKFCPIILTILVAKRTKFKEVQPIKQAKCVQPVDFLLYTWIMKPKTTKL